MDAFSLLTDEVIDLILAKLSRPQLLPVYLTCTRLRQLVLAVLKARADLWSDRTALSVRHASGGGPAEGAAISLNSALAAPLQWGPRMPQCHRMRMDLEVGLQTGWRNMLHPTTQDADRGSYTMASDVLQGFKYQVEHLSLRLCNALSDRFTSTLHSLPNLSGLDLDISGYSTDSTDAVIVSDHISSLTRLTSLSLSWHDCHTFSATYSISNAVSNLTNLKSFSLTNVRMPAPPFVLPSWFSTLQHLERLVSHEGSLWNTMGDSLSVLTHLPKLSFLQLDTAVGTDDDPAAHVPQQLLTKPGLTVRFNGCMFVKVIDLLADSDDAESEGEVDADAPAVINIQ